MSNEDLVKDLGRSIRESFRYEAFQETLEEHKREQRTVWSNAWRRWGSCSDEDKVRFADRALADYLIKYPEPVWEPKKQ